MHALILLALSLVPQSPRTPISIGPAAQFPGVEIASDEELSAITYPTALSRELQVKWSDGRGLDWSAPQVVKSASVAGVIADHMVAVDGDDAAIAWMDRRYAFQGGSLNSMTAFSRTYDASNGILGPEHEFPLGAPPKDASVLSMALALERVGGALHMHVAVGLLVHPPDQQVVARVLLFSSTDGGATFPAPLMVASGQPIELQDVAVAAVGNVVHVAWVGSKGATRSVYYHRSSDAGVSLDGPAPQQLTHHFSVLQMRFAARGPQLLFGFTQKQTVGAVDGDLFALASRDGGQSFGPQTPIPAVEPVNKPAAPMLGILPSGALVAAWKEPPPSRVRLSRSTDHGATWSEPLLIDDSISVEGPNLAFSSGDRQRVLVAWVYSKRVLARLSVDDGATFGPTFGLKSPGPFNSTGLQLAWNERYQNAIATWSSGSPSSMQVGGLRPQTLVPQGFAAGSTHVGGQCSMFDDGSPVAFVLASLSSGSSVLPFGDGRELGLAPDALFAWTLGSATQGALVATLDATGAGTTPGVDVLPLPAGLAVDLVALSVDPSTFSVSDISDVVHVQL
jgi:hypothetical protein